MHIRMRDAESLTNSQINEFLKASEGIEFKGESRGEVYGWIEKMLVGQEYQQQGKKQKGAIRAYLSKVAGLGMAQITRLIRAHARTGKVEAKTYRRQRFAVKYTAADVALLAQVDRAHERLSGPATQHTLACVTAFCSASMPSSATGNSRDWRRSRWRICTTCEAAWRTGGWQRCSNRRDRAQSPSPKGDGPTRAASRGICA